MSLRFYLAALSALVIIVAGAFVVPRYLYGRNVLAPMHTWTAISFPGRVGQTIDFLVEARNISHHTVVMEPLSFPHELPSDVRLTHQAVLTGPRAFSLIDWPPQPPNGHAIYPIRPVSGYQVPHNKYVAVMVGLAASRPGAYVVGPVTFHVDVLGAPVPPGDTVPVADTQPQYFVLCVEVPRPTCDAARMHAGRDPAR